MILSSAPPLLLCIDLQPVFLAAIPDGLQIQRRCAFALAAAAGFTIPVIFTEQVPGKLGRTAPDLRQLCDQSETFGKDTFSAFGDEKLSGRLRASSIKHLFICGIETPICVYQTARDALQAGYQVTILADCVGARHAGDASTVLTHLAQSGCAVLPAETVFYSLLQNARHPFFRDFTALVKKYR